MSVATISCPPQTETSSGAVDISQGQLLEQIEVATGAACTPDESKRFLQSTRSLISSAWSGGPSAQDIECLRQAAWKYRLETGACTATAADLMPVLQKLGYA